MDEEQIEIKDEFLHQHEELQFKNISVAVSAIENTNFLNEEVHIKDEPNDLLPSTENINFINSSICPSIKEETSEICTKSKTFNEPKKFEGSEESAIFVKSETDNKTPEILFGFCESDSQQSLSAVGNDPLYVTVHEEKSKTKIKCFLCPALLDTALELKKHFTTEHEVGRQNDPLDMTVPKILDLKKHFSSAHEANEQLANPDSKRKKDYKCTLCLKVSTKSHDLRRHLSRIHAFECQFCPLKFVLKRDMYAHVKFVHSNESEISAKNVLNNGINVIFKCQFCSSKFETEDDKNKHITFIHEDKTFMPHSPNKCVCYHVIESSNNLERHKTTVHESSTAHEANIQSTQEGKLKIKIVCHLCSAIFDARSDFNKHFSSKHAVKKSVQDDFINEKRKKLKSEKTIQCHLCHAKFTRRGNRKQHISNVHEGIKPHQCPDCPAKFAFKPSLKRHLIEHKVISYDKLSKG